MAEPWFVCFGFSFFRKSIASICMDLERGKKAGCLNPAFDEFVLSLLAASLSCCSATSGAGRPLPLTSVILIPSGKS